MKNLVTALFLCLSSNTFAVDSWYFQLIGGSTLVNDNYDKIETRRERFEADYNVEESDNFGPLSGISLYYTLNNQWLLGISILNSSGSLYGDLKTNGDDLRINFGYSTHNFSAIHYFSGEVGDGYYLRGDVGGSHVYTTYSDEDGFWGRILDPDSTDGETYTFSDRGQALYLGGGRSFAITEGSSFDLGLLYSFIQTSESTMSFLFLTGSLSW